MNRLKAKTHNKLIRKQRVRSVVNGSKDRPRLSVYISNLNVSAQIINDEEGKTIAFASSVGNKNVKGSLTDKAIWVSKEIAKKAKSAKVKTVILDRNGKKYHGRIKAFAESARKEGLEF
ncbi:50S ribosomal protein L18 [Candidatus Saccharibacteria bacterium CPR2]|nr:50S ribosomal protein L18 [Candidatus Saccharibacteria bacterium CPR2]